MGMDDDVWKRHANPWSGWTRVASLPLLAMAIWSRTWIGPWSLALVITVCLWIWLNPRLFGKPKSLDNWMSQGVLGERIWLDRNNNPIQGHHRKATMVLNSFNGVGVVLLILGLMRLDFGLTLVGLTLSMGAKLWFIDRMVWLKQEMDATKSE